MSYLVTLSWHKANQFLPYPNNTEHQARKWYISVLYVIGLTRPEMELLISRTKGMRSTDYATASGYFITFPMPAAQEPAKPI